MPSAAGFPVLGGANDSVVHWDIVKDLRDGGRLEVDGRVVQESRSSGSYLEVVKAIVIGCGRVGSSIARQLFSEGWEVTAVDEKEDALARLGEDWRGGFVLGHGMDVDVLRAAGIEDADAVVVATDGDNTNIVIGQVAQKRFANECVVVRLLDPARAEFYRRARAAGRLPDGDGDRRARPTPCAPARFRSRRRWADVRPVAGGGKVGANLARLLLRADHEVTLIEQRARPLRRRSRRSSSTSCSAATRPSSSCSSAPASSVRPTSCSRSPATTRTTSSSASSPRSSYGVPKVIARVNDPRNQAHFDLLGIAPTICATSNIMGLIEHEVPEHELVHLLELRNENLEIVEVQIAEGSPVAGKRVERLELPDGARLISVTRDGQSEIAVGATELRPGDQVLAILQPGKEDELRRVLLKR